MNSEDMIHDINLLIEYSRYYIYGSGKEYLKNIKVLEKIKKHIEDSRFDKILKKGDSG